MFVAVFGAVAGSCLLLDRLAGGDPMLAVEIVGGAVVAAWFSALVRSIRLSRLLAAELGRRSRKEIIKGIRCEVVRGGGRRAFVLGAIRPRIFVGEGLLAMLDAEELMAVLLHEDHHRRTLAPLRTAALEAWLSILGRSRLIRSVVLERFVDLEELADADAIRRGAAPAAIASALLKSDPGWAAAGAGFSREADRRVLALLELAGGRQSSGSRRLPYEWLPIAALAGIAVSCHLSGIPPLG